MDSPTTIEIASVLFHKHDLYMKFALFKQLPEHVAAYDSLRYFYSLSNVNK